MIILGLVAMVICLLGIVLAVTWGLPDWIDYWQQRYRWARMPEVVQNDHVQAIRENKVRQDIDELYRSVHYRHNVHCPVCGRFSRLNEGLADCTVHGIRIMTVPIEIVSASPAANELEMPLAEMIKLR